ncbi:hypothetical protein EC121427_00458 [Escherichia coli O145:H28]|nr:hypothetical protein EC121427_00458 [Escherichia coli O145:H28]
MIQPQTKRTTGHQQDNDNHAQNTVHITTNGLPRPEQQWPQYEWQKLPLLLNPDWRLHFNAFHNGQPQKESFILPHRESTSLPIISPLPYSRSENTKPRLLPTNGFFTFIHLGFTSFQDFVLSTRVGQRHFSGKYSAICRCPSTPARSPGHAVRPDRSNYLNGYGSLCHRP